MYMRNRKKFKYHKNTPVYELNELEVGNLREQGDYVWNQGIYRKIPLEFWAEIDSKQKYGLSINR